MSRQRLIKALATGTGLLLVAAVGVSWLGDDDQDGLVRTTLADAGSLEEGNEVRAAGVRIGEIKTITLVDGQAEVMLDVDPDLLPIHEDASVKVRPVNLLGENYIDLDTGSASAPFLDDAVIPEDQTETAVTLQDVLSTFQAPTAASLAAVVTTLGEGLHGNGGKTAKALERLAPALQDAQKLGDLLSGQNQVLSDLLASLDPVASALADDNGKTLDRLVQSATDTLAAVTSQQEALEQTILQLPSTLASAQVTLSEFGGVADEATPTLKAIRPLTGDLSQVVDELEDLADSADPALASLEPVLDRADELIGQAAPVVASLRASGPDLRRAATSLRPLGRELLDDHLQDVMDFVRKWSLSTNGRDSLSHYFRGVVYVTPDQLASIANSLVPTGLDLDDDQSQDIELPKLPDIKLPPLPIPTLPNLSLPGLPGLGDLLGLKGGKRGKTSQRDDLTSALGLTTTQEQAMLGQLLGGGRS